MAFGLGLEQTLNFFGLLLVLGLGVIHCFEMHLQTIKAAITRRCYCAP